MKSYFAAILGVAASISVAQAQISGGNNFPERRAVIINNAETAIELSTFSFANEFNRSSFRRITNLKWRNAGSKPITAFEVVIRYYDPFNRPMSDGGRWLITGHDSGNWAPLGAGESSGDGLISIGDSNALTAIVYVRAFRYSDGTVWSSNQPEVEQRIKAAFPQLRDIGTLDPGPKKPD